MKKIKSFLIFMTLSLLFSSLSFAWERLPQTEKLTDLLDAKAIVLSAIFKSTIEKYPTDWKPIKVVISVYENKNVLKEIENSYREIFKYMKEEGTFEDRPIYNRIMMARLEIFDILKVINKDLNLDIIDMTLDYQLQHLEEVVFWGLGSGSNDDSGSNYGGNNGSGSDYYSDCCHPGHNSHCSHCGEHHDPGMPCYYSGSTHNDNHHSHNNYDYDFYNNYPGYVDSPCGTGGYQIYE